MAMISKQEWQATLLTDLNKAYKAAVQNGWSLETADNAYLSVLEGIMCGYYDHYYPEVPSMDYDFCSNLA